MWLVMPQQGSALQMSQQLDVFSWHEQVKKTDDSVGPEVDSAVKELKNGEVRLQRL